MKRQPDRIESPAAAAKCPARPSPRRRTVGNLHQHAGAIAHQRIGADRAAMRQVFQHGETVGDDLVRLHTLHLGDEADAAGIVLVARIVKTLLFRQPVGAIMRGSVHGIPGGIVCIGKPLIGHCLVPLMRHDHRRRIVFICCALSSRPLPAPLVIN